MTKKTILFFYVFSLLLNSQNVLAGDKHTFEKPKLNGALLASAINSPRFPGSDGRTKYARNMIATAYCKNRGYHSYYNWQAKKAYNSHKITIMKEKYRNGSLQWGWETRKSYGPPHYFTYITCQN